MELRAAPVAALLIPLDAVAGTQTDPIRHWPVLLQLLGVLLLNSEWLETSHFVCCWLVLVSVFRSLLLNNNSNHLRVFAVFVR